VTQSAETIIQRNLGIIQTNLSYVREFMTRWAGVFTWHEPMAGPIAFARLCTGSAVTFCEEVVLESGVLLVPSTLFDFGDRHLRWGLGRLSFHEGLSVLDKHLDSNLKNLS
jgi:aspartate/methionine/tyrosine aminotransferase